MGFKTKIVELEKLENEETERVIKEIRNGKIFVYPTDTVYGIGCNAYNKESVEKIYEIKKREREKAVSVIAPSFRWIKENFNIRGIEKIIKEHLPGKYTLLLKKNKKEFLSHVSPNEYIGVRIPLHPFTKIIERANVPFITTSANISGKKSPKNIEEVEDEIKEKVDYIIISSTPLAGKPSTILNPYTLEIIRN